MLSQVHGEVLLTSLLSLNPYTTQDHLSRGSATHRGQGPPTPFVNQENASQATCLQGQLDGSRFSLEVPSSQITLASVKLTKTNHQTNKTETVKE